MGVHMGVQDRASISEADWQIYKHIRDLAQNRYAQRVLDEADRIRQDETLSIEDRYAELSRMVRERDKEMLRIFDTLG